MCTTVTRSFLRKMVQVPTYGPGIDETLTMNRGGQTYYYFYDGLGSVTDLTKASGELVESYQYDVYGNPMTPSSVGNRYMFTGREYDQETGLYHYRARTYNPTTGRFMQRDPLTWGPDDPRNFSSLNDTSLRMTSIFETGQIDPRLLLSNSILRNQISDLTQSVGLFTPELIHRYSYVFNNPINYVDPRGQEAIAVPFWEDPIFQAISLGSGILGGVTGQNIAGGEITGFTKHGINQVITRGISPRAILDALRNPSQIVEYIDEVGRVSYRYIGESATVVLNKFGELITAWPK